MLKSTYSFYRYLTVTCEKYSHFSVVHKTRCIDLKFNSPFHCHAVLQKKTRKKIPLKTEKMKRSNIGETIIISSSSSSDEDVAGDNSTKQNAECNSRLSSDSRIWDPLCYTGPGFPPTFKVVSYNILAQHLLLSHPQLYKGCPPEHLDWKQRSARLVKEITDLKADILCLQEVETKHLSELNASFEPLDYLYVFKPKTGQGLDGCAIFYKKTVFDLVDSLTVEFKQPILPLLNRDTVGIMVKLAHKEKPDVPIVVATTHLLYNPRRSDVKLGQMQLFLAEIDRFAFFKRGKRSGHHPIILTGDFNSTPDSAVVKLLSTGHASVGSLRGSDDWERLGITDNCQHLSVYLNRRAGITTEFGNLKIQNTDQIVTQSDSDIEILEVVQDKSIYSPLFNTEDLFQTLRLDSVYDQGGNTPKVTTYQEGWVRVDYIYYNSWNRLRLIGRLRLPTAEKCRDVRLPNETFGSDHFALGAIFEITLKPQIGSW